MENIFNYIKPVMLKKFLKYSVLYLPATTAFKAFPTFIELSQLHVNDN